MPMPSQRSWMACMDRFGSSKTAPLSRFNSNIDHFSPSPETPDPFHFISSNPGDINAMKSAEKNPQLVMLSDWDHLTAAEYQKVQEDTRLNFMFVPQFHSVPSSRLILIIPVVLTVFSSTAAGPSIVRVPRTYRALSYHI